MLSKKQLLRTRRAARTRARLCKTAGRPRLSVFRSSRHFSAQLIDDVAGKTLASVSDSATTTGSPLERAAVLGGMMAQKAQALGVESVVFDRGAYAYHGRVRAFAEAAREAGLKF